MGVTTVVGGVVSTPGAGAVLTQRLGCNEERREDAEESRDLRPGVAGPDLEPEGEVEVGVLAEEVAAAAGAAPDDGDELLDWAVLAPSVASVLVLVFLLLFLPLAPLFLFSMSESLIGEC